MITAGEFVAFLFATTCSNCLLAAFRGMRSKRLCAASLREIAAA